MKNPGVLGLEYHDEYVINSHAICITIVFSLCLLLYVSCSPFSTRSEDHDHHMTVFPSMRPAGRHEAVALKVCLKQSVHENFSCSYLIWLYHPPAYT